jgi:hypothetical protein
LRAEAVGCVGREGHAVDGGDAGLALGQFLLADREAVSGLGARRAGEGGGLVRRDREHVDPKGVGDRSIPAEVSVQVARGTVEQGGHILGIVQAIVFVGLLAAGIITTSACS